MESEEVKCGTCALIDVNTIKASETGSKFGFCKCYGKVLAFRTRCPHYERHICPLQLDVIERAMELWTAPGDLVFSPFTGIGSEGYTAVKMGRRFIGSELKPSYFKVAVENIKYAKRHNGDLFAEAA